MPRKPGRYTCDYCGKAFVGIRRHGRKYCSRTCASRGDGFYKQGPKNPMWGKHRTPEAIALRGDKHPMQGKHHSAETIAKMRAAALALGDKHPMKQPEARARRSAAWMGDKNPNKRPAVRARLSAAMTGDKNPMKRPEVVAKRAATQKGRKQPSTTGDKNPAKRPAVRAKMSASHKGKCAGDKNPRWLGGVSRLPYAWTFSAELREEVRRRDGYKCQKCGAPQAECRRALDVHHIDYDKKNSDPVNLVALCRSCNSKVNTNRELWTAYFAEMAIRREIATLGKPKCRS